MSIVHTSFRVGVGTVLALVMSVLSSVPASAALLTYSFNGVTSADSVLDLGGDERVIARRRHDLDRDPGLVLEVDPERFERCEAVGDVAAAQDAHPQHFHVVPPVGARRGSGEGDGGGEHATEQTGKDGHTWPIGVNRRWPPSCLKPGASGRRPFQGGPAGVASGAIGHPGHVSSFPRRVAAGVWGLSRSPPRWPRGVAGAHVTPVG